MTTQAGQVADAAADSGVLEWLPWTTAVCKSRCEAVTFLGQLPGPGCCWQGLDAAGAGEGCVVESRPLLAVEGY